MLAFESNERVECPWQRVLQPISSIESTRRRQRISQMRAQECWPGTAARRM